MSYKLLNPQFLAVHLAEVWGCQSPAQTTVEEKQAASASVFQFHLVWFEIRKRNFLLALFLFWLYSFNF